jgi:hypothetical protein
VPGPAPEAGGNTWTFPETTCALQAQPAEVLTLTEPVEMAALPALNEVGEME